ncbi:MAG: ParA family protein [Sphingomonas sp.]|uniref:AAA family ATPase n=1 Tax=Sphingomonas sp. TaxID=28214 RepID=UPI0035A89D29|nr:ParA family protein [Sphingomonas sp.]
MAVISVANPKGGSGKTTLTLVLAAQFASQSASVAVIDADPNAFIAKWHARRVQEGRGSPFEVLASPKESEMVSIVDQMAKKFDFVLIDLEGTASRMTSRAFARSHLVLIPYNLSPIDASLAADAVRLVTEESEALNRSIEYRLVRSRENAAIKTKSARRIGAAIADAELPTLEAGLVERAAYRDMFDFAKTLDELDASTTSGLVQARANARAVAASVFTALTEGQKV